MRLLAAGLPYDSPEGRQLAQEVLAFVNYTSKLTSRELAEEIAQTNLLRNSSTIAIPPTGRSAPVIGASTGIEPLFRLTDPHLPGHIHLAARSTLEQAGRTDLLGHVMTHGRLPDDTDRLRRRLPPGPAQSAVEESDDRPQRVCVRYQT